MTLTYPLVLLALAAPILLIFWTICRSGREVAMPFDSVKPRSGIVMRCLITAAELVPILLLAVIIIILAGPQRWKEPTQRRKLTNIEFCVDISGSMTAQFGNGSRYDASMAAINDFLDYRQGDAFGLTFFGNSVLHWIPLTNDVSAFRCAPPFMRPEVAPPWFGGTEIGKALLACKEILTSRDVGDRMIVLVSDGFSSDLMNGNDKEIARDLKKNNIVVYAIHVAEGDPPGEVITITSMTGGEVFSAGDPDALHHVFGQIDQMQVTELEKTTAESLDHFQPWCIAGLVLLSLGSVVLYGLRYTPW